MIHPARQMTFDELQRGLIAARDAKLVSEQIGADGLRLYCYTRSAVYDRQWTPFTLMARGLIIDADKGCIVATPFPKFVNVGERGQPIPDLPFETFEKVDGSLIIISWHRGAWRAATKGSLNSEQARWAGAILAKHNLSALVPGATYLAEAVYAENRIVVRYSESGLILLAAYDTSGGESSFDALCEIGSILGWRTARRHAFSSISDLIAHAGTLPATEEGFVLRFANGLRLKVKGDEYKRIHALVSRVSPLAIWEMMQADDDLQATRRELPEEFWGDFDGITSALNAQITRILTDTKREADAVAALADKDVGLRLETFPAHVRSFIFPYRKQAGDLMAGRARQALFRSIRPTANNLPGYTPSYAIGRVVDGGE